MSTNSATHQPRTLVLCFDGTSNRFDSTNTNVVKFHALLNKRCPRKQVVYYQPGIGTFIKPGVVSPAFRWIAKKADLAFAWYMHEHIMGGYEFLMNNYHEGDKICLFGFSRGAYTARTLAEFLHRIGLLPRDNDEQVHFAYNLYKRTDLAGRKLASKFKETFCMPVVVDFLGVWDTVGSVGFIYNRAPPLNSGHSAVRIARHALALDEHRARFKPNRFSRRAHADTEKEESEPPHPVGSEESIPSTLEVWFAGCHCDVGGGAVENTIPHSLGEISLRWMVKQVYLSKCGIEFDSGALEKAHIVPPTTLSAFSPQLEEKESGAEVDLVLPSLRAMPSSSGEGGDEEYAIRKEDVTEHAWIRKQDVIAGLHDELKIDRVWWFLEYFPMKLSRQKGDGTWHFKWGTNRGRPRKIKGERPIFHESVRQRINSDEIEYQPAALWKGEERYVH